MNNYDVIIIGAGLAGLSTAHQLVKKNIKVLIIEKEKFIGGRSSSWNDNGMMVESGFHRHIGFYKELPCLLNEVGVNLNKVVIWEEQIDILIDKNTKPMTLGIAPFYGPSRMIMGLIGNNHILSFQDKTSLLNFFIKGFKDYYLHPKMLDNYSVHRYAKRHRVTNKALNLLLTPLSTGIFFLPPTEYSAKVFFGLFAPAIPRFPKMRIGAYLGGMGEILANPIGRVIEDKGGDFILDTEVIKLIKKNNKVVGVKLKTGEVINAKHVVLATDISHAKKLLKDIVKNNSWFQPIFKMPTMSAVTIQFDLSEPALPYDRTTFAPLTIMTSFAEQSRSTFKHVPGRLSVILSNPNKYINYSDIDIYSMIIEEASSIGINLTNKVVDYRVIRHKDKFYHLGPRHDYMRPTQKTPVKGLILAGDYTRQPLYATMEGAVISGKIAANIITGVNN
jgi:15-cis-phytoene desaturase